MIGKYAGAFIVGETDALASTKVRGENDVLQGRVQDCDEYVVASRDRGLNRVDRRDVGGFGFPDDVEEPMLIAIESGAVVRIVSSEEGGIEQVRRAVTARS